MVRTIVGTKMLTQSEDGTAYHPPLTTSTTLDTITQPALISTRSVSYLGPHNDETRNQDKLTCPTTDSKSIEEFVNMGFYQNFGRNNESKEVNEHADNEFMNLSQDAQDASMHQQLFRKRKPRKFVLEANKDDTYWERRRKNNEAAKRSRGRRRANNMSLESRVIKLTKVNNFLTAQLRSMYMRLQRRSSPSMHLGGQGIQQGTTNTRILRLILQNMQKRIQPCTP